jgi:hypothetical protein
MVLVQLLLLSSILSHVAGGLAPNRREKAEATIGSPSLYQSPRFRWWWPGGWIDTDEVTSEITSIINAGFGGGEIGNVQDSITVPSDPKIHGWAQERWNKGIAAAYTQSNK